jgi:hypothetical protein
MLLHPPAEFWDFHLLVKTEAAKLDSIVQLERRIGELEAKLGH